MAKLFFRYGAMNSGKSTMLIQVAHNYMETGQTAIIIKPKLDTKSDGIHSRIGVTKPVDIYISEGDNVYDAVVEYKKNHAIDAILVDEVQFITPKQVEQLFELTVKENIPVIAYGLRTDFMGRPFPGASRAFDLANVIEEIRTKCFLCGKKADHNSRTKNGEFEKNGAQVVIDDGSQVEYISLCSAHFMEKVGI